MSERTPRSVDTFGVAGLLSSSCRVYYEGLFSVRHLGRVSDLFAAKLKDEGADELALRALVLFAAFEGWGRASGSPFVVECGIDSERMAVGVGFPLPEEADLAAAAAIARGSALSAPEDDCLLLKFIRRLQAHAEEVYLRVHRPTGRAEVVACVDRVSMAPVAGRFAFVNIAAAEVAAAPAPETYIELGDLDYPKLLAEDGTRSARPRTITPMGRRSSSDGSLPSDEEVRVVRGGVSGEETGNEIRIHGVTDHLDSEKVLVKGQQDPDEVDEGSGIIEATREMIRKVWPFRKGGQEEEGESFETVGSDAASSDEPEPEIASASEAAPDTSSEVTIKTLVVELQAGGMDRTLAKAQKEAEQLKKEAPRAQRWVNGFMGDLISEKARLHEMAKKLNVAVRQKEIEFLNKEQGLKEELRRKDEMLRQRSHQLNMSKDQLTQANLALERMRSATQGGAEDGHFKQKFNLSQRLLTATKDDNAKKAAEIEELKNQVANLKATSKKGVSQSEMLALKDRYERTLRQIDEFKRANHDLMEKLNEKKSRAASLGADETRKKIEAAVRLAAVAQKENGQLQLKVEELSREDARLRRELEKATVEIRNLKSLRSAGRKPPSAA